MSYWLIFIFELIALFLTSKHIYQSLFTILYRILRSPGIAEKIVFLIFFPGVIVHELSHMLIAEITFVRTFNIDISPKFENGYLRMGSVEVAKTDPARRALIGLAPLISGILIISAIVIFLGDNIGFDKIFTSLNSFLMHVALIWVIFLISNTMFSSRKDMEGALVFLLALAFFTLIGSIALILLGQNPLDLLMNVLTSEASVYIAKNAATFLILPVAINGIITLIFYSLSKKRV